MVFLPENRWTRSPVKKNGDIRKQFAQWTVPKEIRSKLGLSDGSECMLTVRHGKYSSKREPYKLTSGGEVRLLKYTAKSLRVSATSEPTAEIRFEIEVEEVPGHVERALGKARTKALEDGDFDPRNDKDARNRTMALIVRRQGQPAFRNKLLKAYDNRCAISGCDCPHALEAAHIRPYRGKHTNHVINGILLRSDIHTLLDFGKIHISRDHKVSVCDELQTTVYKDFHNKTLSLPKERKNWPDCRVPHI